MATKQREREVLAMIREVVDALGEGSYIGTAFEGVFDLAEQNIEYDAAFSFPAQIKIAENRAATAEHLQKTNNILLQENAGLRVELEKEQGWKPYESDRNVKQADYERLASGIPSCAHYMSIGEAKDWICDEFGFTREKITVCYEVDEEEISRGCHCRPTGRKIDRRPIYCATDYHYIRFDVGNWYYEVWNGRLRPYYC